MMSAEPLDQFDVVLRFGNKKNKIIEIRQKREVDDWDTCVFLCAFVLSVMKNTGS